MFLVNPKGNFSLFSSLVRHQFRNTTRLIKKVLYYEQYLNGNQLLFLKVLKVDKVGAEV